MSLKVYDGEGRWRNNTVAFRMSPEESEQLNIKVRLSGLTKQEYLINRSLEKEIVVMGNPRVFKALRNQMNSIIDELKRLEGASEVSEEFYETLWMVTEIMEGMRK